MATFTDRAGSAAQVIAAPDTIELAQSVSKILVSNTDKAAVWELECPLLWGTGVKTKRIGVEQVILESPKNLLNTFTATLLSGTGELVWEVMLPEL